MFVYVAGLTIFPPEAASYQSMRNPPGTVAVAVKVCTAPFSHTVTFIGAVGAAGLGLMVKVTGVLEVLTQPVLGSTASA